MSMTPQSVIPSNVRLPLLLLASAALAQLPTGTQIEAAVSMKAAILLVIEYAPLDALKVMRTLAGG